VQYDGICLNAVSWHNVIAGLTRNPTIFVTTKESKNRKPSPQWQCIHNFIYYIKT